jgi:cyclophilin family peptidyl-prolyl cis-trans isomerase
VLTTKDGPITAELFEAAAPKTLRRLAELVEATRSAPASKAAPLTFDYAHPHIEIYASPLGQDVLFENEIDAEALGLDRDRVKDGGQAGDIIQREVVPAINRVKRSGTADARLQDWMAKWRATENASFLVGVSRKEINEALGYPYCKGLDSRPVTKGALSLQPESPGRARARLGIALSDLPTRLGRQMVIGRVVSGLDLADQISIRPLAVSPGMRSLDFKPKDPVVVGSVQLQCRE